MLAMEVAVAVAMAVVQADAFCESSGGPGTLSCALSSGTVDAVASATVWHPSSTVCCGPSWSRYVSVKKSRSNITPDPGGHRPQRPCSQERTHLHRQLLCLPHQETRDDLSAPMWKRSYEVTAMLRFAMLRLSEGNWSSPTCIVNTAGPNCMKLVPRGAAYADGARWMHI